MKSVNQSIKYCPAVGLFDPVDFSGSKSPRNRELSGFDVFILLPDVLEITGGKSRTTIWRWIRAGIFPKPRKLGPNSNGWLRSEIATWVQSRESA